jgi:hypothetical protein
MICERPECDELATHNPVVCGGLSIPEWTRLCCHHADTLMMACALTVPLAEGRSGWVSWRREHRLICGPHKLTLVGAS